MTTIVDDLADQVFRLLSNSRNIKTSDTPTTDTEQNTYSPRRAKIFLRHLSKLVDYGGRSIIDVGCGAGDLCITLAKTGARHVVGVDFDPGRIASACRKAAVEGVEDRVAFECVDFVKGYQPHELFEMALSQASFEHILGPLVCLRKIYDCLADGGVLGTLFGPLWCSPYGAHTRGYTRVPWAHFLFPEEVVLRIRAERYRPDEQVDTFEDIKGHLNRITVRRFRQCVVQAGFEVQVFRLNPAQDTGVFKPLNVLVNTIPVLQELGSLQLLAVLRKPQHPNARITS